MIELLLGAERALAAGLVDQAERLYRQAADGDPQNSIAVVGLARVALERGDEPEAWRQAQRALGIDPENVAAQRLAGRLEEIWAYRGESLPDAANAGAAAGTREERMEERMEEPAAGPKAAPEPSADPAVKRSTKPGPPFARTTSPRSVVDRLFRRKRP